MDRPRLPPGGRALLLPAVLLALAWAGSAPAATADFTQAGVRAPATPRPHLQGRRTPAVQPAAHHQRRAWRALTPLAILGAGLALEMAAAASTRRIALPWRPGARPLVGGGPRAPPLAA